MPHKLNYTNYAWYVTLFVSSVVYIGCFPKFIYDVDYMASTNQPYQNNYYISILLVLYLFVDLWYNDQNKLDTHIHHVESIIGLLFSLYNKNVGIANNCLLNEVSTIWLSLLTITAKFTGNTAKFIQTFTLLMFTTTFVTYRIIPVSGMFVIITQNIERFAYDTTTCVQVLSFFVHTILQYYWFILIINKIHRKINAHYHLVQNFPRRFWLL